MNIPLPSGDVRPSWVGDMGDTEDAEKDLLQFWGLDGERESDRLSLRLMVESVST